MNIKKKVRSIFTLKHLKVDHKNALLAILIPPSGRENCKFLPFLHACSARVNMRLPFEDFPKL